MKKYITSTIVLLSSFIAYSQHNELSDSAKINWLKENAVKISSISPLDTNFFDLVPLKNIFKNVNILMLGEAAHGEGNVISAKIRLVKYLHEQMGFDMIVFESGFYDFNKANESIKNGKKIDSTLNKVVFPTWTNMTEFDPLLKYINDCNQIGNKPLSFAGFDDQNNWLPLEKDIEKSFPSVKEEDKQAFFTLRKKATSYKHNPFGNIKDSLQYFKYLDLFKDLSLKIKNKEDGSNWLQVFKNLESNSKVAIYYGKMNQIPMYTIAGTRDEQMADNLIWLIEHNPSKKIIVWSASNHLSRNLKTLKEVSDTSFYAHYKPMGEYIKNKYGDLAYSLGFTAAGGTWYAKGMMPAPKEVKPATNNSIECYMQRADFNYGLISLLSKSPIS